MAYIPEIPKNKAFEDILSTEETSKSAVIEDNKNSKISGKEKKKPKGRKADIYTHEGHKLTIKEAKFIDKFIETGNASEAVRYAGYKIKGKLTKNNSRELTKTENNSVEKAYSEKGYKLKKKPYIAREIQYRLETMRNKSSITVEELYDYLAKVVRGEIKDQFGLEVSVSERTRAATELLKRFVDIPNKLADKESTEVKVTLDWKKEDLPVIDAEVNKKDDVEMGMITTQVGD